MKTSFKTITNIQSWRLAAITIGSALAMSLATTALAANAPNVNSGNTTGTVGVAFSYQITANQAIPNGNWGATGLPPGLTGPSPTGLISGTPTTAGMYTVHLSAANNNGTGTKDVTFTINSGPASIATISPTAVWAVDDTVTLDGSQSHTNPPGGTLVYLWQQLAPGSPVLSLSPDNKTVIVTFPAPAPQPLGTLSWPVTYNLKVTDNSVMGGAKNTTSDPVTTTVYAAPVADAEPKGAHVNEGAPVTLNGGATMVQPGATLSYTWTAPAGITLSNIHAQNPTFTAPQVGPAGQALTFTLVVTEHLAGLAHDQNSASNSVTINVDNVNAPPTATANTINDPNTIVSMATVAENTVGVTLYGFGTDPDNDPLTFTWTQVHDTGGTPLGQPGDIAVTLSDNHSTTPTFTAPNLTTQSSVDLVFQLIANDGQLNSGPSYVTIRVNNTNDPPTAVPTATPAAALEGDMVTLDGSGSSDPNHDTLTYSWAQVGTPGVTLVGSNLPQASFVAPTVNYPNPGSITLTFNLTVDDGNGGTDTKPVSVTVSHRNQPPVANAGQTLTVPELSNACLDGSTSYDPEGDNLSFAWVQVDGPSVTLDNPATSGPCFDTPAVGPAGATLHFQLTVTDSHNASSSATVEVDVTYVNHPPTADAGPDQGVNEGDIVHLSGSGTDPDNNPLLFGWSQSDAPPVTIVPDPSDPSKATFIAPQVSCNGAVVVMTLTVDDQYGGVTTDDVEIDIANVNHDPTAKGGGNQNAHTGQVVTLSGSGDDQDPGEASSLIYQWEQVPNGAPTVTLTPVNQSGSAVTFTAPDVGGSSVGLEFKLTVTDVCGGSGTDVATITVANPIALAQGPPTVNENASGMLNGSGSYDPDGDSVTYKWTQISGPTVTLDDETSATPSFTAPWVSADSQVKFQLVVKDPTGFSSAPAYVTFTIINWNQPPDISGAHAGVGVLWPPDHRMIQVQIVGVTDAQMNATIRIDKVTQDEPTNGLGDGDTPIDAIISGDSVLLRAERSGKGNGRVYWVYFTASDPETTALGTSPQGVVKVMVPHDKKTDTAIDSGQNYDSTH